VKVEGGEQVKKSAVSAANMEVLLVHAVVQPKARTGEVAGETRAAKALGVHLMGLARELPVVRTWRARAADGRQVALQVMADSATDAEKEQFARVVLARKESAASLVGVLPVHAIAGNGEAFQTDLWTTGTAKDLAALGWPLNGAGLVHGCLCVDNILLDDELRPILSEAGLVQVQALAARKADGLYERFVAPEVRDGAVPDVRSDVFSLGRLLQELAAEDGEKNPNVVEIIHRATAPVASARFASVAMMMTGLQFAIDAIPAETRATAAAAPAEAKPSPKREEPAHPTFTPEGLRKPSEPWRAPAWLGLVGIIAAGGSIALAALLGGTNDGLRGALAAAVPLGAALATTLLPPLPRATTAARFALALGVAVLFVVFDPLALAYRISAQAHVQAGDASQRAAIAEVLRLGRDFRGLSLAGANMSGLDMTGADLRGVSCAGADLTGARLFAAEVDGTSFDGAQLAGADFTGVGLALASTVNAHCDRATKLPSGWKCAEGTLGRN
jgi:Pentapeptide repeats (8 copies)/Protein tyrosine and serine/threonine kinase